MCKAVMLEMRLKTFNKVETCDMALIFSIPGVKKIASRTYL